MAALSYDLTDFLNTNFHGLISRASKMAIRLMLAHHHVGHLKSGVKYYELTKAVCGTHNKTASDVRTPHAC